MYCTYLTIYSGDKLPPFYVGSSSVKEIENGYFGSAQSNKYGNIYRQELIDNLELFDSIILKTFETRKEALGYELEVQRRKDVVKSPLFFNEAFAQVDGFFGMDNSGELNSMFGLPVEDSPNFGSKWMNFSGKDKRVQRSDIDTYLTNGWIFGRNSYTTQNPNKTSFKKVYINDGSISKSIKEDQLNIFLRDGWFRGRVMKSTLCKHCEKQISNTNLKRHEKSCVAEV